MLFEVSTTHARALLRYVVGSRAALRQQPMVAVLIVQPGAVGPSQSTLRCAPLSPSAAGRLLRCCPRWAARCSSNWQWGRTVGCGWTRPGEACLRSGVHCITL